MPAQMVMKKTATHSSLLHFCKTAHISRVSECTQISILSCRAKRSMVKQTLDLQLPTHHNDLFLKTFNRTLADSMAKIKMRTASQSEGVGTKIQ
jgi:hypothetical protein